MNYEHEALKRKIMSMRGHKDDKHSESEIEPDAHGDMSMHQEEADQMADEIAGAAPSLKSHELSKKLGAKPALVAGVIEGAPDATGEEHGIPGEESEDINPKDHEAIMHALKSRGSSPLASKAHEMMKRKMAMK